MEKTGVGGVEEKDYYKSIGRVLNISLLYTDVHVIDSLKVWTRQGWGGGGKGLL